MSFGRIRYYLFEGVRRESDVIDILSVCGKRICDDVVGKMKGRSLVPPFPSADW